MPAAASLQAWAELEAAEGQWLLAVKLLEQALAADSRHLPSWMVSCRKMLQSPSIGAVELQWCSSTAEISLTPAVAALSLL
jgi:hypothetical protein